MGDPRGVSSIWGVSVRKTISFSDLLVLKAVTEVGRVEERKRQTEIFHVLVHSLSDATTRAKPGQRQEAGVSVYHVGVRGPSR